MADLVELHVVSDSTGETAARVVEAVEAQFPGQEFEVVRHPRIAAVEDVHLAAQRARGRRAVVLFTLVEPEMREVMRTLCKRYRLHYCDLLGHPIEAVARVSGAPATRRAGARTVLDASYFKRIAAIEFAVRYDDGAGGARAARGGHRPGGRLAQLEDAALDVPRVSRVQDRQRADRERHRAAAGALEGRPAQVVGLTIDAERLAAIRGERVRGMGGGGRYADLAEIYEELEYAESIHKRLGCPVIEVSNLAIEETARRIVRLVEERRLRTRRE